LSELLLPLDVVMTTLRLPLLSTRGDASNATPADRSVTLSGSRQWRQRDQSQSVSDRPSTRC